MMKHCLRFLLILLPLGWTVPVHASDFTVFGGFTHPSNVTLGQASAGPGGFLTDPSDFAVLGARLYRSSAPVGLEHTLAYGPNFLETRASALIYNTNLRIELPSPSVQPYGTVGIGFVRAGGSGPASFGTKFTINYGVGVRASLLGPFGVRLDVRRYSIRGVESTSVGVLETSVGFVFAF